VIRVRASIGEVGIRSGAKEREAKRGGGHGTFSRKEKY
jgi:hypothetical protein